MLVVNNNCFVQVRPLMFEISRRMKNSKVVKAFYGGFKVKLNLLPVLVKVHLLAASLASGRFMWFRHVRRHPDWTMMMETVSSLDDEEWDLAQNQTLEYPQAVKCDWLWWRQVCWVGLGDHGKFLRTGEPQFWGSQNPCKCYSIGPTFPAIVPLCFVYVTPGWKIV